MKHHVLGYRCNICGADAPLELKTAGGYHQLQTWLKAHKQAAHKGTGRVRPQKLKHRRDSWGLTTYIDGKGW